MKRKAFTILDILVLLAIICLIASVLVPTLIAARRQAQSVSQGVSTDNETPLGSVVAESNEDGQYRYLPLTATNIIEHGNDWYEFTLSGQRWLYHTDGYDQESLVMIPKEQWSE